MSNDKITINEVVSELRRIENAIDGMSSREIAEKTGLSITTVQRRLRRLYERGLVKVSFRRGYDITGKSTLVPVYKIIKKR